MPVLSNPKHERFAQELAKGKTADEAYVLAGYKPCRKNAHRLTTNDDIRARVAELQGRAAERATITLQNLIDMSVAAYDKAMKSKSDDRGASAAVNAVKEIGVLTGHRVEKSERTNKTVRPDEMTDDELAAIIKGESGAGASQSPEDPTQLH